MKRASILAIPLLALSTPAVATGGYSCRTPGPKPIHLSIVTGHGVAPMIAQVRIVEGAKIWSTAGPDPSLAILQSWIDERELRLDIVDPKLRTYQAQLRTRMMNSSTATGTLLRNGVKHHIRCTGDQ